MINLSIFALTSPSFCGYASSPQYRVLRVLQPCQVDTLFVLSQERATVILHLTASFTTDQLRGCSQSGVTIVLSPGTLEI